MVSHYDAIMTSSSIFFEKSKNFFFSKSTQNLLRRIENHLKKIFLKKKFFQLGWDMDIDDICRILPKSGELILGEPYKIQTFPTTRFEDHDLNLSLIHI